MKNEDELKDLLPYKNPAAIIVVVLFVGLFLIALPVYAASSDFLAKASDYYQRRCTRNIERITGSTAILCYLFDKTQEHDQMLQNIEEQQNDQQTSISNLEASTSANLADINLLKQKNILAYGQYRGAGFTTTSNTDVPTDAKVDITCSFSCVLWMNYVVDTRNNQVGAHNIYTFYLDGVNLSFVNQASYAIPNQAIPLALTGLYPAAQGIHTIQVYSRTSGGQLEEHTKTLTVIAIGQ